MRYIQKFKVQSLNGEIVDISMPKKCRIISVGREMDDIMLYTESEFEEKKYDNRRFKIFINSDTFICDKLVQFVHVGTTVQGTFAKHIYEVITKKGKK